jgi:Methuselah N-terminus
MKCRIAFFVLFLHILLASAKYCQDIVRLKLEGDVQVHSHNRSISHNNVEYPEGTHWKDGSDFYGCPCKIKQCLRLCNESEIILFFMSMFENIYIRDFNTVKQKYFKITALAIRNNFTVPDEHFRLQVWHDEQLKSVNLHDHFIPIRESKCENGFLLEPDYVDSDAFTILANGSIHYTNLGEDQPNSVFGASQYCIVNNVSFYSPFIFELYLT